MNITVIGAGNLGTLMAAEFQHRGHSVTLYTSKANVWSSRIEVYNNNDEYLFTAENINISNNLKESIKNAELVFLTYPAQMFNTISKQLNDYMSILQTLVVVPGTGGAEFVFKPLIDKGVTFVGLQRVHSVARVKEIGKSVYMCGTRDRLYSASIPNEKTTQMCEILEDLFRVPTTPLSNYLSVTLTPSNPILHTARLYSMFKNNNKDSKFNRMILFYEEWTDESSEILLKCDRELQQLCNIIPLDLSGIKSLKEHYDSYDPGSLTKKIRSISAFKGLTAPMKKIDDFWAIDLTNRYFTTDFPYGLKIILDIANLYTVEVPTINTIWKWYRRIDLENSEKCFKLHLTKEEFENLYK